VILVVDDDDDLRRLLERELQAAGYRVTQAASGAEAIERARRHLPSLVLLDMGLPDLDGVEVLRRLKASPATARAAVVMVSGRCGEADRIAGFELGADDYIGKPFSLRELMLRVQAVHRRVNGHESDVIDAIRRAGRIEIDPGAFVVRVDGASVALTVTEFRLLQALSDRGGRVCTHAELEARAGGAAHVPQSRVLQTHMRRLRRKLGEAGASIETVRAVGYRLRLDR
jgi:DNA-binding response OmpR family regulator